MDLAVDSWTTSPAERPPPPPADRPDDAPPWYRGDEIESQAFLEAVGMRLG